MSVRGGDGDATDRRRGRHRLVAHRLRERKQQRILLTCNQPKFAALPPRQIVPTPADRGLHSGSERSFYRMLHAHGQDHRTIAVARELERGFGGWVLPDVPSS